MKDNWFWNHITQKPPKLTENLQFLGVTLHGKDYRNYCSIDSEERTLKESIGTRLFSITNVDLAASHRCLIGNAGLKTQTLN
jgi:hypothetical protein